MDFGCYPVGVWKTVTVSTTELFIKDTSYTKITTFQGSDALNTGGGPWVTQTRPSHEPSLRQHVPAFCTVAERPEASQSCQVARIQSPEPEPAHGGLHHHPSLLLVQKTCRSISVIPWCPSTNHGRSPPVSKGLLRVHKAAQTPPMPRREIRERPQS